MPHWEEYSVQISNDFIRSLSLCAQMSTKSAQKQVFLLIFRVKICRYALGTKNKNVRHVEKNKISKNKKISPRGFWEIWKRAQKTGVFAPLQVQKTKNSKIGLCTFFRFATRNPLKKKLWKSVARSSHKAVTNGQTNGRGQNHRSLRSTNWDQ